MPHIKLAKNNLNKSLFSLSPLVNTHKTFYMLLNHCTHRGVTQMWPFGKKEDKGLDLPPLSSPKPIQNDEIELIPEDIPEIPSEIPSLKLEMPKKEEYSGPVFPIEEEKPQMRVSRKIETGSDKFITTDAHRNIILETLNIKSDLDNVDFETNKVINLKTQRYEKIDGLQKSLEEVSKKLMYADNMLLEDNNEQ